MIELADKKRFVSWLIQSVSLKKRESYWILNYLLNHDAILKRVVFVEGALNTPRGILITDKSVDGPGLEMVKNNVLIHEADQIFYDIRRNRKDLLYMEIIFEGMQVTNYYLSVLEDNQYEPIDDEFEENFSNELAQFLKEEEKQYEMNQLSQMIDQALEEKDEKRFKSLSKEYFLLKNAEQNEIMG